MATTLVQPYYLPGLTVEEMPETSLMFGTAEAPLVLHYPILTPAGLEVVSQRLLAAQDAHLATRPVAEIVDIIDRVVQH